MGGAIGNQEEWGLHIYESSALIIPLPPYAADDLKEI